mgnify:CR=1 FL=1
MIQWAGPCLYVDGPAYDRAKDASEQRTFLPRDGFVECVAKHRIRREPSRLSGTRRLAFVWCESPRNFKVSRTMEACFRTARVV